MEKVTISQLKDRLSAYLKKVRAGRTIVIMDRDQPIARLERIEPGGAADDRLARLERAGIIRRGKGRIDPADFRPDPSRPHAGVLAALLEERREGR